MPARRSRSFTATIGHGASRRRIHVPFNPDEVWGPKRQHRVTGTIGESQWRGSIVRHGDDHFISPGPAWWRDCGVEPGTRVKVALAPEGPQRDDLAPDFVNALEAEPAAGEFFDSLAQFYRKGYLRYIEATKRRPELRAERIAEVVALLKAGKKERP